MHFEEWMQNEELQDKELVCVGKYFLKGSFAIGRVISVFFFFLIILVLVKYFDIFETMKKLMESLINSICLLK